MQRIAIYLITLFLTFTFGIAVSSLTNRTTSLEYHEQPLKFTAVQPLRLQESAPANSRPKTVLDYYLLLPEEFFEASKEERVNWMLDPKRGAIVDLKNGYVFAPGDGAQTSLYVCLFRRPHMNPVVVVKSHPPDTDEYTYLNFYEYNSGALVVLTNNIVPVHINEELTYKMPCYDRSIEVTTRSDRKLYKLVWSGASFVKRP